MTQSDDFHTYVSTKLKTKKDINDQASDIFPR